MSLQQQELVNNAAKAFAEGRLDTAETTAQKVLEANPENTDAMLILGLVAERKGDPDTAILILSKVAELDPTEYQSRLVLSVVYRAKGLFGEALDWAQQAVALDGEESRGQNQLGLCYLSLKAWEQAGQCFFHAIQLAPGIAVLHSNLGQAMQGAGLNVEAARAYSQSLAIQPRQINVLGRLASILLNDYELAGATECARRMLEIDPFSPAANILYARVLAAGANAGEALMYAARAAKYAPEDAEIIARYGTILQMSGEIQAANEQFEKSIELNPRQGHAYRGLTHNRKIREEDRSLIEGMSELAEAHELGMFQASDLEYAIGKANDDLGEFEEAMKHFDNANRILSEAHARSAPFDKNNIEERMMFPLQNFNREFIDKYKDVGSFDDLPIFVTGMIRSGTTLAEQILSSHPAIGGAGEQSFWDTNYRSALESPGNILNRSRLGSLCEEYVTQLRTLCPDMKKVVDKMPPNFNYLGFLYCAFPNGRFIHMKRNPVDTCLSIWKTPNQGSSDWSNRKDGIVFYYKLYLRIAEHWRQILPSDRYMEVQYEDLVSEPERVTREMIAFCGMEWDDACLSPQDNVRTVATPSLWQVRQPVYQTSTERWRKYEPWLGEFAELLDLPAKA